MPITQNKIFPLDISNVGNTAVVVKGKNKTNLWHLCYGHFNVNGLVIGLPKINELE